MTRHESASHDQLSLNELAQGLNGSYYSIMKTVCVHTTNEIALLKDKLGISIESWASLSEVWMGNLSKYLELRIDVLVPYLLELNNKETTGHNCSECSGKCDMQHAARLAELDFSNVQITQLYSTYLDDAMLFRDEVLTSQADLAHAAIDFLNSYLFRLIDLERSVLIPRVRDAQKTIRVYVDGN